MFPLVVLLICAAGGLGSGNNPSLFSAILLCYYRGSGPISFGCSAVNRGLLCRDLTVGRVAHQVDMHIAIHFEHQAATYTIL